MHINDEHLYHGAALTQIAEHHNFTAINASINAAGVKSNSVFQVNHNIGIMLKYASKPNKSWSEYIFTFTGAHLREMEELAQRLPRVFAVLVCVKDRLVCALSFDELKTHIRRRENANGGPEPQYTLLVTAPANQQLRVYMNRPGRKKVALSHQLVPRNAFPDLIFH